MYEGIKKKAQRTHPAAHAGLTGGLPTALLPGLEVRDLVVNLVYDLVVGFQLVEVDFEVVRRLDVGQDQRIEVHCALVAP